MPRLRTKLSERREITRARKATKKAERLINPLTPEERANLVVGKTAHELFKDDVGIPADMIKTISQFRPLRQSQRRPPDFNSRYRVAHLLIDGDGDEIKSQFFSHCWMVRGTQELEPWQ